MYFLNTNLQAGCDSRSDLKHGTTGSNAEFSTPSQIHTFSKFLIETLSETSIIAFGSLIPFSSVINVTVCTHLNIEVIIVVVVVVKVLLIVSIKKGFVLTVHGNQKASFSIAISPRYKKMALHYSLDCSTLPLILTF